jgi:hypothetical protein
LPKVILKTTKKSEQIINTGDLVIFDNEPFLVSQTDVGKLQLISLEDGNRWSDECFAGSITLSELRKEFLEDYENPVELIKSYDYEITIKY